MRNTTCISLTACHPAVPAAVGAHCILIDIDLPRLATWMADRSPEFMPVTRTLLGQRKARVNRPTGAVGMDRPGIDGRTACLPRGRTVKTPCGADPSTARTTKTNLSGCNHPVLADHVGICGL